MICQLILVALAFNQANALSTCYTCSLSATEDSSSGWSTALTTEVASRTFSVGTGNCAYPGISAPGTVDCSNGTSFCSKSFTEYTLSDTDNSASMMVFDRGCLVPVGGNYASYETNGCWSEGDTDNQYIVDALASAVLDTTNGTVTIEYESYSWCLCDDVDNCNAAGHTMAAVMLVAAMALLNFL